MSELRASLRAWSRTPWLAGAIVTSLVIGFGANVALFAVASALFLAPLPITAPQGLVRIVSDRGDVGLSMPAWEFLRDESDVFESVLATVTTQVNIAEDGVQYVACALVSTAYFETLGVVPIRGRTFRDASESSDGEAIAIISARLWRERFQESEDVLGRVVIVDGRRLPIVGVAPKDFVGVEVGRAVDVFIPLTRASAVTEVASDEGQAGELGSVMVFGRLRNGQTIGQAEQELRRVQPEIRRAEGVGSSNRESGVTSDRLGLVSAERGVSFLRREYRRPLLLLSSIAGVVMLVTAVNLSALLVARFNERRREIAVRHALGASGLRLAGTIVAEVLPLMVVAVPAAIWGGHVIAQVLSQQLSSTVLGGASSHLATVADWRLIGMAVALAGATTLVAVAVPARKALMEPALQQLGDGGRTGRSRQAVFAMNAITCGQVAISMILVSCASLLVASFLNLTRQPAGLALDSVVVVTVGKDLRRVPAQRRLEWVDVVRAHLASVPGVRRVGVGITTPLGGLASAADIRVPNSLHAGMPGGMGLFNRVSADFFEAMGAAVVAGRDFSAEDGYGTPLVVVVNKAFTQRHYGGSMPVGQTIMVAGDRARIVGVVTDSRVVSLFERRGVPMVFGSLAQAPTSIRRRLHFVVNATSPDDIVGPLAAALRAVDPAMPVEFTTLQEQAMATVARERLMAVVSSSFGVLGLVTALVGLYGGFHYMTACRAKELAIRIALGSTRSGALALAVGRALLPTLLGMVIGLGAVMFAGRWVDTLLFDVSADDPWVGVSVGAAIALTAIVASILSASRIVSSDPMATIREL